MLVPLALPVALAVRPAGVPQRMALAMIHVTLGKSQRREHTRYMCKETTLHSQNLEPNQQQGFEPADCARKAVLLREGERDGGAIPCHHSRRRSFFLALGH